MILLAGDSWGAGAWGNNMNLIHGGLAQYLYEDRHQVVNLSHPGGWNGLTFSKLETFLKLNSFNLDSISHIFVFQTEWLRDIQKQKLLSLASDDDFEIDYQTLKDRIISRFYYSLSNIGKIYNKKIYIIGGASDTLWFDCFSIEYPNLEIVCQSFTNLLINNCHRCDTPTTMVGGLQHVEVINDIKNMYIKKDIVKLLDDIDLGSKRFNIFKENKKFFFPDLTHPNQESHKILFDYLKGISLI